MAVATKAAKAAAQNLPPPQQNLRDVLDWLEQHKIKCSSSNPWSNEVAFYAKLILRCGDEKCLDQGKRLHSHIVKVGMAHHTFLANNLIRMYGSCGDLAAATAAFEELSRKNVCTWNIFMAALLRKNNGKNSSRVLQTYRRMLQDGVRADRFSISQVLCGGVSSLAETRSVHAGLVGSVHGSCVVVSSSLVNAYRKHGTIDDVERAFASTDEMARDEVAWTNMLTAYVEARRPGSALGLLPRMDQTGVKMTLVSYGCLVAACAQLARLREARRIAARIAADPCVTIDGYLQTSLVDMFAKCGSAKEAEQVFQSMRGTRNVVAWTSMITAFVRNGHNEAALRCFWRMEQDGCKPDAIAFTHVLYACGHAGLIDEAWCYFSSLERDRNVELRQEHVGCMVDLLSRTGKLADAEELLNRLPTKADAASWMCLLNACKMHSDLERGERAAEKALALEPSRTGPDSVLSSMYFAAGKKEKASEVIRRMHERGSKKPGGRSWIEIDGKTHEFLVGDTMHPRMPEIRAEVRRLSVLVRDAGYASDTGTFVHADSDERVKEDMLGLHSEKLAMALGIISTPPKSTLRIVKNLRVCPDCHTTAKAISKLLHRTIVIRDLKLFHHVQDGVCSCGDYW